MDRDLVDQVRSDHPALSLRRFRPDLIDVEISQVSRNILEALSHRVSMLAFLLSLDQR
jgi:hypothetical protein